MEQDLSILIADLSGYTALTETHGATSAADLIDDYLQIVNDSLVGNSYLHQQVGDEVVIISETPHHLLSTAIILLENTLSRSQFLAIHGAMHHGSLVRRKNNLFGSALNLTSRIASKAKAGSMLCTSDFRNLLPDDHDFNFQSAGFHQFKNVTGKKEVFEVITGKAGHLHIDPVCRMIVNDTGDFLSDPSLSNLFFCSQHCLDTYQLRNSTAINDLKL